MVNEPIKIDEKALRTIVGNAVFRAEHKGPKNSGRASKGLSEILATHRLRAGLSQRALSKQIGMYPLAIEQYEMGYRGYSIESLALLWRALGDAFLHQTLHEVLKEMDSGQRKLVNRNKFGSHGRRVDGKVVKID